MDLAEIDRPSVASDTISSSSDDIINYAPDGAGNDASTSTVNETGGDMRRIAPPRFAPGTTNIPVDGPNPREISNVVVAGDGSQADLPDPSGLSGMMYAFGQFIDHDLDLNSDTQPSLANSIDIATPEGDPYFAPGSTIPLTRGVVDQTTGAARNSVTGWLDLSQVYGSDPATAADLRGPDGRLKTSPGDNLPIVNGAFAAGDSRAAENPSLTALQTLFLREHNFWTDKLHSEDASLTSDQLFNQARAIVTAEYQNIVLREFLPHLLGPSAIPAYEGYDPAVNPQITEEFAGAAFRFGHSIVSDTVAKLDNNGSVLQSQSLGVSFFEPPSEFESDGGAGALLRHLAADASQKMDVYIINSLRNLLVDTPDGQDLAAINIERGRDFGLGTLNETREALHLQPYTSFDQITADPIVAANLKAVYGSVDNVELWTGGLAEDHARGALVGTTFQAIIADQFEALRDGDPLFFQNQPFKPALMSQIKNTTLSDIILRNTDTTGLQADAFIDTPRQSSDVASSAPTVPQPINAIVAGLGENTALTGGGPDNVVFLGSDHNDTVTNFTSEHSTPDLKTAQMSPADFSPVQFSSAPDGQAIATSNSDGFMPSGVHVAQISESNILVNHRDLPLLTQH